MMMMVMMAYNFIRYIMCVVIFRSKPKTHTALFNKHNRIHDSLLLMLSLLFIKKR